jgi:hypothetical protein
MSQLKVYGWSSFRGRTQSREVVAAHSLAEVARLAGYKRPSQMFQLTATGNGPEIAQAMQEVGVVFWHPLDERPIVWRRSKDAIETSSPSL